MMDRMSNQSAVPIDSIIAVDFQYGEDFQRGHFCVIEPDVIVGDNVRLGHYVTLKSGTRICNNVELADYCCTTGLCIIGNNVMVHTRSTISKGVIVDDCAFIGAGVMTSHTRHIYHGRPEVDREQAITRIGYGAVVGSGSNLAAGASIAVGAIVGYHSNVIKPLRGPNAIYLNRPHPWATLQRYLCSDSVAYMRPPDDYKPHQFDAEMLARYLPYA